MLRQHAKAVNDSICFASGSARENSCGSTLPPSFTGPEWAVDQERYSYKTFAEMQESTLLCTIPLPKSPPPHLFGLSARFVNLSKTQNITRPKTDDP